MTGFVSTLAILVLSTSNPSQEFERMWSLSTSGSPFAEHGHHVRFRQLYEPANQPSANILFEVWKHGEMYRVRQDASSPDYSSHE